MATFLRGSYFMNLASGSDATPYIPGDGKGSALARVTAAKDITAIVSDHRVTLNNVTSLVVGQLVVTTDGYWGSIVQITGSDIVVDQWRFVGGANFNKRVPATGTSNLNVFPAGSIMKSAQSVTIEALIPLMSVTAATTCHVMDYRMVADPTALIPYNSAIGNLQPIPFGTQVFGPIFMQIAALADLHAQLVFTING